MNELRDSASLKGGWKKTPAECGVSRGSGSDVVWSAEELEAPHIGHSECVDDDLYDNSGSSSSACSWYRLRKLDFVLQVNRWTAHLKFEIRVGVRSASGG